MDRTDNKVYHNQGNVEVLKLLPHCTTVLDIGCGTGAIAAKLREKQIVVDGISLSEKELNEAKNFLRNAYIFNLEMGLPAIIGDNVYDCIICSHVLEHIAYPELLFRDIKRVLKKDGYVIVALPNVFYYKYRIQLLKGSFLTSESGIWDYTHLRWYSYSTAMQVFKNNGFEIEVASVSGELPFSTILRHIIPLKGRVFLYQLLTKISKGLFGYQLLFRVINKK